MTLLECTLMSMSCKGWTVIWEVLNAKVRQLRPRKVKQEEILGGEQGQEDKIEYVQEEH